MEPSVSMPMRTIPFPQSVRVALLVCDEPSPNFHHGTTFEIYRKWLVGSLPPGSDFKLKMKPYNVYREEYPTSEEMRKFFDVIMVTGSAADASGQDSWIRRLVCYVQHVHNKMTHIRIFGVGFGHQIVGRAMGGIVTKNKRWEYGRKSVNLTQFGQAIFGVKNFKLLQMHRDHVALDTLSDHFSTGSIYLLGSSLGTTNQGFVKLYEYCGACDSRGRAHDVHQHTHVMTVQGRPELTHGMVIDVVRHLMSNGTIPKGDLEAGSDSESANEPVLGSTNEPVPEGNTPARKLPFDNDNLSVVGKAFWKIFGVKYET